MSSLRSSPSLAQSILDWIASGPKPGPESDQTFDQFARKLFAQQSESVPAYRRWIESRGMNRGSVERWLDIPAIPISAFKEHELHGFAREEHVATFHSSGTTGLGTSRHLHNAQSLGLYEASALRGFEEAMLEFPRTRAHNRDGKSMRLACLSPSSRDAPHSSLAHMFECVKQRFPWEQAEYVAVQDQDGAWHLDLGRLSELLRAACRAGTPVVVLGTAFMFVHALDFFARAGATHALPEGSRLMETGGYKGRSRRIPKEQLHSLLSRFFGLPPERIVCEYGMSELSSQAYDARNGFAHEPRRRFEFPPWTRIAAISPEHGGPVPDGEPGLLRVYDLANTGSVFVVQTEDLVVAQGQSFELLGRSTEAEPRGCSLLAR